MFKTEDEKKQDRELKYNAMRLEQHIKNMPHTGGKPCPYCTKALNLEEAINNRNEEMNRITELTSKHDMMKDLEGNKFKFLPCKCFPNGVAGMSSLFTYFPDQWQNFCACTVSNMKCDCRTIILL